VSEKCQKWQKVSEICHFLPSVHPKITPISVSFFKKVSKKNDKNTKVSEKCQKKIIEIEEKTIKNSLPAPARRP